MLEINFVRHQRQTNQQNLQRDRKIVRLVTACLFIFLAVFLVVMAVSYFVQRQITTADASIQLATQQLSVLSPLEKEYVVFVRKVQLLYSIEAARKEKRDATSYFYSLIPSYMVLTNVVVDDKQKVIRFTVEIGNVFDAVTGIQVLYGDEPIKKGYPIALTQLSRSLDGKYQILGTLSYDHK